MPATRRTFMKFAAKSVLAVGAMASAGRFGLGSAKATHNCPYTSGPCPCTDPCGACNGCQSAGHCPSNCSDTGYCWTCAEPDGCTLYCRTCNCNSCNCYCDYVICPFRPQVAKEAA